MDFTQLKLNLEALGYKVSCFENGNQAVNYLKSQINSTTVGVGGSMTVKELGLMEELSKNNDVICHWTARQDISPQQLLQLAQTTDVYICSANGLSQTGEIVNIDGSGNRLSGTLYGHKKVYFIIGKNKVAPTCDQAIDRARNIAAPLNARRLNRDTPCAKGDLKCHNCNSPQRICRSLNVLWRKPTGSEYEVVLINENLGY